MTNAVSSLIVYVTDRPDMPATVEAAGILAQSFGASLTGLHVTADAAAALTMAPATDAGMAPGLMQELQQQARTRAEAAQKHFEDGVGKHGWKSEWRCLEARGLPLREAIAREVYLSDLVVVGQQESGEPGAGGTSLAQDLVVESGRPVLIRPQDWSAPLGERHVLVGWKPSREAARAVHDALPFLARADGVTVTAAMERNADVKGEEEPGAVLCRYLERRGIACESRPVYGVDDSDTGTALFRQGEAVGADLMVLGAYSHSRLREGIFGGVTRDVTERTEIPAFLSPAGRVPAYPAAPAPVRRRDPRPRRNAAAVPCRGPERTGCLPALRRNRP